MRSIHFLLLLALVASSLLLASSMPTEPEPHSIFEANRIDGISEKTAEVADAVAPLDATGKVFVHSKAIDLFQTIVNSILENSLKNLPLPDERISIVGGHVDLSNIVLKNVDFTAQQVGLVAPNQVTIDFSNFQGELDLNWEYHGPLGIRDHGSATNKFSSTSISSLFTFSSDSLGRPSITLNSLEAKINDLDIHLSGGGAWLINLLIKLFKPLLRSILEENISSVAAADFNTILAAIQAKYPLVMPLTGALLNTTQVNLGLVQSSSAEAEVEFDNPPSAFLISGNYLIAAGEWFFSSTTNSTVDQRQHDYIPDALPTNPAGGAPMMGFSFDEAFLGTLLFTLTENKKLDFYLDNSILPPSSLIRLNTHLLSAEFPALYNAYPNNNISIAVTQFQGRPPLATTSPAGSSFENAVSLMINVIDPSQQDPVVPVCELLVNYTLNTNFEIVDNTTSTMYLTGDISPLVFNAEILWADLNPGNFASEVQTFVTALTDDVLIPIIDGALAKGLPMPIDLGGLNVANAFISYGNHVMSLGFDIAIPSEEEIPGFAQSLMEWTQN